MKILFIYSKYENLGIEYLSSYLKSKGHEVKLLFDPDIFSGERPTNILNNKFLEKLFNIDKIIIKKAIDYKPDLIAFSTYTGNYRWCLKMAESIKQITNIPIVFGGVHTSAVPERVISNLFVDFAIVGEGEFAMLDLLDHLKNNKSIKDMFNTPNLCFKYQDSFHINKPRPYIRDLDSLPFPDKLLFFEKAPSMETIYLITTSRGCPYDCTYCSNNMYHALYACEKQHIRQRSVDNVIEELSYIKKRGRMKQIHFADDVFTYSIKWLGDFISKFKSKINLPFDCSVHPLTVNKEIAHILKEGGCSYVLMGVQSWSERIRKEIFNRRYTNERIIEALLFKRSRSKGIYG